MPRALRYALWAIAIVIGLLLIMWAALPWWLPTLARQFAAKQGVSITALNLGYPGLNGVFVNEFTVETSTAQIGATGIELGYSRALRDPHHVERIRIARLRARVGTTDITATGVELSYSFGLRDPQHLERIKIAQLRAHADAANISAAGLDLVYSSGALRAKRIDTANIASLDVALLPSKRKTPTKIPKSPEELWQLVPLRIAHIGALRARGTTPAFAVSGKVDFDQQQLHAQVSASEPIIAAGSNANLTLTRAGKLTLQLGRASTPSTSLLAASGNVAPHSSSARIDAALNSDHTLLNMNVDAHMPTDLLSLASAAAGIATRVGMLDAQLQAQLPWPLPDNLDQAALLQLANSADVHSRFALQWQGDVPTRLTQANAKLRGDINARTGSVAVHLDPGSLLTGQLVMASPLRLFGQSIAPMLTVRADKALDLTLAHEQLRVSGKARASIGTKNAGLTVQLDALQMPVSGRPNVALGDGATAHVRLQADLARTTFGHFTHTSDANVSLAGNVATLHMAPHATLGLGKLGDWSHGQTTATNAAAFDIQLNTHTLGYRANNLSFTLQLPKATFGTTDVTFAASTLTVAHLDSSAPSHIATDGALATHVTSGNYQLPINVAGTIGLNDDKAHLALTLAATKSGVRIPFTVDHDIGNGSGALHVDTTLSTNTALMKSVLDKWTADYDLDSGKVKLLADLQWRVASANTRVNGIGSFSTIDAQAHYTDYLVRGANIKADWQLDDRGFALRNGDAHIAEAFVGTPVTAIAAPFSYQDGVLTTPGVRVDVVGGHAITDAFHYVVKDGSATINVKVDGLALDKLLALEGGDIEGAGTLDGNLPVSLVNNVPVIHGGRVRARPPGGTIAYGAVSSIAEYARGPGLEFAFNALKDFHYTTLDADVEYAADTTMKLAVRLYGRNPTVEKGRTIHYNLNVSENVADLLRSLRASTDVSDRFAKRLSQ